MRRAALLLSCALVAGCASYTEVTEKARTAYYQKDYGRSLELWTELLDGEVRPDDAPLMLLERGVVNLAAGSHAAAARDLHAADQRLEILDFGGNPGEAGKYLFSEDSGVYRGPPHEKILAPTLISLAYAAGGDHENARTASNAAYSQTVRFTQFNPGADFPSPLVNVLVGVWAEQRGDTQRAFTAYEDACKLQPMPSLAPVLARLLDENARRFGGHWIKKRDERRWGEPRPVPDGHGELIVVVLNGRAPIRVGTTVEMTQAQRSYLMNESLAQIRVKNPNANMSEARGMVSRQNDLPMAVLSPRPSRYPGGSVTIGGGSPLRLEEVLDVQAQVAAWDRVTYDARATAALSRLAIRLAVRIATYLAVRDQSDSALVAFFASAVAGAALAAADTPDTRCWTLLPRHVLFQRVALPAGRHPVDVVMQGGGELRLQQDVQIRPGDVTFAVFVVPD